MWNYQREVRVDRCHSDIQPVVGERLSTHSIEMSDDYWLWMNAGRTCCYLKICFHWIPNSHETKPVDHSSFTVSCTYLKYLVMFSRRYTRAGFLWTDSICMLEDTTKSKRKIRSPMHLVSSKTILLVWQLRLRRGCCWTRRHPPLVSAGARRFSQRIYADYSSRVWRGILNCIGEEIKCKISFFSRTEQ